jgi:hypothetical protein
VGFVVSGAKDRDRGEAMKVAVDKSFPALLKALHEVGETGANRVRNARASIEGTRAGFKDIARSGGALTAAAAEAQLIKCFDELFKKAETSAESVERGIEHALNIRGEASK